MLRWLPIPRPLDPNSERIITFLNNFGGCYFAEATRADRIFAGNRITDVLYMKDDAEYFSESMVDVGLARFHRPGVVKLLTKGLCIGSSGLLTAVARTVYSRDTKGEALMRTPAGGTQAANVVELCGPDNADHLNGNTDIIFDILCRISRFKDAYPNIEYRESRESDHDTTKKVNHARRCAEIVVMYCLITCAPLRSVYAIDEASFQNVPAVIIKGMKMEGTPIGSAVSDLADFVKRVQLNADIDDSKYFFALLAAQMGWQAAITAYVAGATNVNEDHARYYAYALDNYLNVREGETVYKLKGVDFKELRPCDIDAGQLLELLAKGTYHILSKADMTSKAVDGIMIFDANRQLCLKLPLVLIEWSTHILHVEEIATTTQHPGSAFGETCRAHTGGRLIMALEEPHVQKTPGPYVVAASTCLQLLLHLCVHKGAHIKAVLAGAIARATNMGGLEAVKWICQCAAQPATTIQRMIHVAGAKKRRDDQQLATIFMTNFFPDKRSAVDPALENQPVPLNKKFAPPPMDEAGAPSVTLGIPFGHEPYDVTREMRNQSSFEIPQTQHILRPAEREDQPPPRPSIFDEVAPLRQSPGIVDFTVARPPPSQLNYYPDTAVVQAIPEVIDSLAFLPQPTPNNSQDKAELFLDYSPTTLNSYVLSGENGLSLPLVDQDDMLALNRSLGIDLSNVVLPQRQTSDNEGSHAVFQHATSKPWAKQTSEEIMQFAGTHCVTLIKERLKIDKITVDWVKEPIKIDQLEDKIGEWMQSQSTVALKFVQINVPQNFSCLLSILFDTTDRTGQTGVTALCAANEISTSVDDIIQMCANFATTRSLSYVFPQFKDEMFIRQSSDDQFHSDVALSVLAWTGGLGIQIFDKDIKDLPEFSYSCMDAMALLELKHRLIFCDYVSADAEVSTRLFITKEAAELARATYSSLFDGPSKKTLWTVVAS